MLNPSQACFPAVYLLFISEKHSLALNISDDDIIAKQIIIIEVTFVCGI